MAKLPGMSIEGLLDLRKRIDEMLHERRAELEKQLDKMGAIAVGRRAKPRWLVAAIKGGKKLEDFLIDKSARTGRRKRRWKR
jgi:hypothetical protein